MGEHKSPTAREAGASLALMDPDRAGRVHRPHDRFGDVTTACGASRIFVPYIVDVRLVDAEDRCPKCWPSEMPPSLASEGSER